MERLESAADYLLQNSVWTAPFGTVFQYIRERDSARIIVSEFTSTSLSFRITVPFNDGAPLVPLTVRIVKPESWNGIRLESSAGSRILKETAGEILMEVLPERTPVQNPSIVAQLVTLRTRS